MLPGELGPVGLVVFTSSCRRHGGGGVRRESSTTCSWCRPERQDDAGPTATDHSAAAGAWEEAIDVTRICRPVAAISLLGAGIKQHTTECPRLVMPEKEIYLPKLDDEQHVAAALILWEVGGIDWEEARRRANDTPGVVYRGTDGESLEKIRSEFDKVGLNPRVLDAAASSTVSAQVIETRRQEIAGRKKPTRIILGAVAALVLVVGTVVARRAWFPNPEQLVTSYISAVETSDNPESQSFIVGHSVERPLARLILPAVILNHKTTGEQRFEDSGVRVYRRFIAVEITNKLNQRITEKFQVTAYFAPSLRSWRVVYFGPAEIGKDLRGEPLFGLFNWSDLIPQFVEFKTSVDTKLAVAGALESFWGGNPVEAFRQISSLLSSESGLSQSNTDNLHKVLKFLKDSGLRRQ